MKRSILFILFTLFLAVSVVLALHIAAPKKENHKHAGFDRVFAPGNILKPLDTLDLKYNSYYIAGADTDHVYLGNYTAFNHILSANLKNIKDTTQYKIKADSIEKYMGIKVRLYSSYFYLLDGNMSIIHRGNVKNWIAYPYMDGTNFSKALPISDTSLALIKIHNFKNTFYKIIKGNSEPEIFPSLLEEQHEEGLFSTDGELYYDKNTEQLVFIYFYRNEFLYMDKNFNIKYKAHTIDTINEVKIKTGNISSENKITMSAASLIVNKKHCISINYLYNNSNILAANENTNIFENNSVIDIYSLEDKGQYQHSFYIPSFKEKKMKEFVVINNSIILARYEQYIIAYQLNMNYMHLKI
ncbi:hypothetical protein [Sinomicrobium sp. M5D2P17]